MSFRFSALAASVLAAVIFGISCSQQPQPPDRAAEEAPPAEGGEYAQKLKEGADLVGQENYPEARRQFEAALKIAEQNNTINEIVAAKTDLANTYAFEKDLENAGKFYDEAFTACDDAPGCRPERLDVTAGLTSFFNLTIAKDIKRQEELIGRIKASRVFNDAGNINARVCKYIDRTRALGFDEAEEWAKRESCPPPVERVDPHKAP